MIQGQRDLFGGPPPPRVVPASDCEIRVFSLWRPWPQSMHGVVREVSEGRYAFVPGPKWIENRGWHPPKDLVGRCFLALHSGLTYDSGGESFLRARGWSFPGPHPKACITGVAFLKEQFGRCEAGCDRCDGRTSSDPFYMGAVAWVLSGRVPLVRPVPCVGGQGLRKPSDEVRDALLDEYSRTVSLIGDQLEEGPRLTS